MKENKLPEFRLDSFNLVTFIFKYWKLFLFTGVVTFVVSAAVSLTIKPMYRSTAIMYPSSNITTGVPGLFTGTTSAIGFGDEEATEKVLQILVSDRISDYIAGKYNLMDHYGIDPGSRYPHSQLASRMKKLISFQKTRFMSVEVSVLDRDPEIAASMANDISTMIDSTFIEMLQEAGEKYLSVIESQYYKQEKLVMSFEDSLLQSSIWTEAFTGYNPASERASGSVITLSNARPFSPQYIRFSASHQMAIEDLGMLRKKYTEAKMAATEKLPYTLMINRARTPEKKAFPDRSSIVILSTLSVLLFVMLVTIIIDGIKMMPDRKTND